MERNNKPAEEAKAIFFQKKIARLKKKPLRPVHKKTAPPLPVTPPNIFTVSPTLLFNGLPLSPPLTTGILEEMTSETITKTPYKNGKKEGIATIHTLAGVLLKEISFKDDALSGPFRIYHGTGHLSIEMHYAQGELSGNFTLFSQDGKARSITPYIHGKIEGTALTYDEKERVIVEALYEDDQLHGEKRVFSYDENNSQMLVSLEIYERGQLQEK